MKKEKEKNKEQELLKKLNKLNTDYYDFASSNSMCLDGNYTIEQLEIFIELLKGE